ncbi:2 ' -5 ' oligoadenylate synthetase 1H [Rattus norvegicus]|uniref:2 '-5 ' oligoadenylate synthetase 1H n=1 Tax=Rattus norvegicus TaxID=10116 RepID=A6J1H1_RAT|nr:2 ' -5 ' oligoadenylate synthetase 1H [Rattus norvegicus]
MPGKTKFQPNMEHRQLGVSRVS